ncbi:hypothetical protein EYF80_037340 [Liparis tanakae]|uniref:Uncharacterized protein n=1 Tax=Liparis tanakae TaxID=230148 RepID=A0A4Z2GGL9_9TELE|nr:hypothetical protein EYF80_037340 [Liparis tanakae]
MLPSMETLFTRVAPFSVELDRHLEPETLRVLDVFAMLAVPMLAVCVKAVSVLCGGGLLYPHLRTCVACNLETRPSRPHRQTADIMTDTNTTRCVYPVRGREELSLYFTDGGSSSPVPSEERCQYLRSLCLACSPLTILKKGPHRLDSFSNLPNSIKYY